jgi:DNA-binding NtrC family response regulator
MSEFKDAEVLIVDDDEQILVMLQSFLELKGIKSATTQSPTEALDMLRASDIKLILLDINMPEMTGVELLQKIIELVPSANVIMITGFEDLDAAKKCMELGAKDYITKPFDFKYLETSIFAEIIPML